MYIAHRGNCQGSEFIENTLFAFKRCKDIGVNAVEFDVHVTFDGYLVVVHDAKVCGYNINEVTLKELQDIDCNIPLLGDVLDIIGENIVIDIEIKSHNTGKRLGEFLKYKKRNIGNIVVTSFIHKEVLEVRRIVPDVRIGWIYRCLPMNIVTDLKLYDVDVVVMGECVFDEDCLASLKEQDVKVWIYTLNDENIAKIWLERGVDGIVSDTLGGSPLQGK